MDFSTYSDGGGDDGIQYSRLSTHASILPQEGSHIGRPTSAKMDRCRQTWGRCLLKSAEDGQIQPNPAHVWSEPAKFGSIQDQVTSQIWPKPAPNCATPAHLRSNLAQRRSNAGRCWLKPTTQTGSDQHAQALSKTGASEGSSGTPTGRPADRPSEPCPLEPNSGRPLRNQLCGGPPLAQRRRSGAPLAHTRSAAVDRRAPTSRRAGPTPPPASVARPSTGSDTAADASIVSRSPLRFDVAHGTSASEGQTAGIALEKRGQHGAHTRGRHTPGR